MERPTDPKATIKDWADYLADLIKRAKGVAAGTDAQAIKTVAKELLTFRDYSPEGAAQLDNIASQAAVDICEDDLQSRLGKLSARDAEFAEIYKKITAATPQAPPKHG